MDRQCWAGRGTGSERPVSVVVTRNEGGNNSAPSTQTLEGGGGTRNRRNLTFRQLTDADIEDRRRKRLCFHCDEPFSLGHVCQNKHLNILILVEESDHEEEEEIREEERAEEHAMQLNIRSVAGMTSQKSLKL